MKKIISLFKRDYKGDGQIFDEVVPGAEWVIAGEGTATRKWDGTCCMMRNRVLYKRYDRKKKNGKHKDAPEGWEAAQDPDEVTGHWPGWIPIGGGPEDQWHIEALPPQGLIPNGTYELCGPKVQGNPENMEAHALIRHGVHFLPSAPRTFAALATWFLGGNVEGIVWHHHDGRMVKIKGSDFGVTRNN